MVMASRSADGQDEDCPNQDVADRVRQSDCPLDEASWTELDLLEP